MGFKEWLAEEIGYRFFGCLYNRFHDPLFNFIATKVPADFLGRNVYDLGCGDGSNTLRIGRIFKAHRLTGYDHNNHLLQRARRQGLEVKKVDLNTELPSGELAAFTFSLHHFKNKEEILKRAVQNFDRLFLCEPIKDLYHALFDAGKPLKRVDWLLLFDKTLKRYVLHQFKNQLIIFYRKE